MYTFRSLLWIRPTFELLTSVYFCLLEPPSTFHSCDSFNFGAVTFPERDPISREIDGVPHKPRVLGELAVFINIAFPACILIRLAISVARSWRIFVYNLIASHLRKPNLRNLDFELAQPSHRELFLSHKSTSSHVKSEQTFIILVFQNLIRA